MTSSPVRTSHPLVPGAAFAISAAMLLFGVWHGVRSVLAVTGGVFVYGLDDPYIHLAIARSIVDHGVFGVTPEFVSFASSSPIWPLLLACVAVVTDGLEVLPLVLNTLAMLGSLWMVEALGKREGIGVPGRLAMQLLFLVLTPALPLVFSGMEHSLHLFTVLVVIYLALDHRLPAGVGYLAALALAMAFSVLVRYESVFLAMALAASFLSMRKWRVAVILLSSAALTVVAVSVIMLAEGGQVLANSLLVKGPLFDESILQKPINFIYYYLLWPTNQAIHWREMSLAFLTIGALFVLRGDGAARHFRPILYAMLLFIALHILTVRLDQFSRYTGYLIGSGLVVTLLAVLARFREIAISREAKWDQVSTWPLLILATVALWPLLMNGMTQSRHVSSAARNIYEQQYQLGRFLAREYRGESVVLNDLGAMTYFGGIDPVDFVGLAETRVALARRAGVLNTDTLRAVAADRGARIAVVYPEWFPPPWTLPEEWIPVQEWLLQDNIICGGDTVRFYGVTMDEARLLQDRLRAFRPSLPSRVGVRELPLTGNDPHPTGKAAGRDSIDGERSGR